MGWRILAFSLRGGKGGVSGVGCRVSGSGLGLEARAGVIFWWMDGYSVGLGCCGRVPEVWIQGRIGVWTGVVSVVLVRDVIRRKKGALSGPRTCVYWPKPTDGRHRRVFSARRRDACGVGAGGPKVEMRGRTIV